MVFIKNFSILIILSMLLNSCSINKMVTNKLADKLSSQEAGTVFTGDDDPDLIRDAIPFALKLYESLLLELPDNEELLLATGKAYIMYSFAFVHLDAEKLPDEDFDKKKKMKARAKKLYLRGRKYILQALECRHPGFDKSLKENKLKKILSKTEKEDVPYLFWCGMSWMGAYSLDPFDMEIAVSKEKAVQMIKHCLKLNETFEDGAIHNFFISYYGSIPESMGGDEKKARKHFKRSLEISKGKLSTPYMNLAVSVSVKKQDVNEYKKMLNKVLEIDIDASPKNRLVNILTQQKAEWLLTHLDNYFLLDKGENDENN